MSKVLKNILARAHKKGPFNDGRKIGLVLPGGCMSGVVGAGAVVALEKLGLAHAFDIIHVASAGFPNATYMLSENSKIGATVYYTELRNRNFINFLKFWKPVNFDRVVQVIKSEKPIDYKKVWECNTELYLKIDKRINDPEYIKLRDYSPEEYFDILKTAISFPLVSKGGIIRKKKYYDGEVTDKDHRDFILKAVSSEYTDLLIIYNQKKQQLFGISFSEDILEITPDEDISIFETRSEVLKKACEAMTKKVLETFSSN